MKILHFRRRLSGVLAMLCFVATLSAQRHMSTMNLPPDPVADQADRDYPHFFDYFNQITTTGLLQDRSSLRVKLRHFSQNLLIDETAVTREDYGYLYASLRVAATSPSLEPPPAETTYMAKMQLRYPSTMIKLFGIAYRYDYVREDAITLGFAHLTQHQLIPDTDPATLLRIDTVFAIAPQVHRIDSSAAYLLFPDMVKNLSLSISEIEVNANEGLGWQVIPAGRGVWINFSTPGIHDITVRTSDGNGWWLLSHFKLFTDFNNTNSMFEKEFKIRDRISYDPDNPRIVDITSEEVYEGQNSKVKLFILGNCEDNLLRKPLIMVDGFEPRVNGNSIDLSDVFYDDKLGSQDHPLNDGLPDGDGIEAHQALFDAGYDLVFVDWADWEIFDHVEEVGHLDGDRWIHDYYIAVNKAIRRGGQDYIQRNAKAIETALKFINNEKATITFSGLSNQLIGMSMGGSVCKWALLDMEEKAIAHDVENFYSYDSPLKGANITIGLQAMLFDLAGLKLGGKELKNEVPALQEGIDVLTSPFAKQTLLAQVDAVGEFALFDQIQDEYAKKGKNRNGDLVDVNYRCISNGSLSNIHQINIEPGGLIGSLWADIKSELDKNTIQSEKTKDWVKEVHYAVHSVLSAFWW